MSYTVTAPDATQPPNLFPPQSIANFGRLKTIIEADHQFNLSATGNDGYHKVVHMMPQTTPTAVAGIGQFYSKTIENIYPCYKYPDSAGVGAIPEMILPTVGAMALFQGRSTDGACTILGASFNCTAARTTYAADKWKYTITFTTAMPSANYIYSLSLEKPNSGTAFVTTGSVVSRAAGTMDVEFRGRTSGDNAFFDPTTFSVLIYFLSPV